MGGFGTFAYAAANSYLDAFAHEMSRRGKGRWIAVDWEAWQRTQIAGLSPDLARFALDGAEGAQVLERVLDHVDGPPRVVVSTVDLEQRHRAWAARGRFAADPEVPKADGAREARPDLETLYQAPSTDTERLVAEVWQRTLGLEKVGVLDSFFELGGDSLIAVQTASQLEKIVGRRIPVVDLYDGLTVQSLAAAVDALQAEEAEKHRKSTTPSESGPSDSERRDRKSRSRESQLQQRARRSSRRQPAG